MKPIEVNAVGGVLIGILWAWTFQHPDPVGIILGTATTALYAFTTALMARL